MDKLQIIEKFNKTLLTYNRDVKETKYLKFLPTSKDHNSKYKIYIIKCKLNSFSNFHRHNENEEFYVIYDELVNDDRMIFKKDDYVKSKSGTEHSSYSKTCCTLFVVLYGGTNELF